jgi:hypothetical protein
MLKVIVTVARSSGGVGMALHSLMRSLPAPNVASTLPRVLNALESTAEAPSTDSPSHLVQLDEINVSVALLLSSTASAQL